MLALAGCGQGATASPPATSPATSAAAGGGASAKPAASPASSAAGAAPRVRAAWVALTANQLIWPLAKDAGYFDKYGVNFDLQYIQGSGTATQTMIAKEIDMAGMAGSAVVGAQAAGADVIMVAGFLNQSVWRILGSSAIKSLDDLKGKTVAVTKVGNADYFAWKIVADKQGWKETDFKYVAGGTPAGQAALLQSGNVQALAVSPPNDVLAERAGAHLVFDTSSLHLPEQQTGMTLTKTYLAQNRATALNVLKASIEGIARWKADPAFAKGVIKKYLKDDDQTFINAGYDAYAPLWAQPPYPSRDGFQTTIGESVAQNPKAKNVTPDQCIDLSLVKELVDSGFIKKIDGG